jgi:hypothetical protein
MSKITELRFGELSLGIPDAWVNQSIINYVGPPAGDVFPNVVVLTRPTQGKQSMDAYIAQQKAALSEAELPGLEVLNTGVVRGASGPIGTISFRFHGEKEGQQLRQDQFFLLADKTAYTMCLTCAEGQYEKMQPTFQAMLKSFKVA